MEIHLLHTRDIKNLGIVFLNVSKYYSGSMLDLQSLALLPMDANNTLHYVLFRFMVNCGHEETLHGGKYPVSY